MLLRPTRSKPSGPTHWRTTVLGNRHVRDLPCLCYCLNNNKRPTIAKQNCKRCARIGSEIEHFLHMRRCRPARHEALSSRLSAFFLPYHKAENRIRAAVRADGCAYHELHNEHRHLPQRPQVSQLYSRKNEGVRIACEFQQILE